MKFSKYTVFITSNLFLNNGGLAGNDLVYILFSVSSQSLFAKVSNSMFVIEINFLFFFGGGGGGAGFDE